MHLRVVLLVHSYTLRVVGSGIKAQSSNPEVKVKVVDPVVNQIIDKLRHINQVSSCPFTDLSLSLSLETPSPSSLSQTAFLHVCAGSGSFQTCLCLRVMRLAVYRRLFTHVTAAARLLMFAALVSRVAG